MYQVPADKQRGANKSNPCPREIQLVCPSCDDVACFGNLSWTNVAGERARVANDHCLNCGQHVTFVAVAPTQEAISGETGAEIFAYPPPAAPRPPLDGLDDVPDFGDRLQQAYESALQSYNTGNWAASAVLTRRVLEGVVQQQLPEEMGDQTLFDMLEVLPEHVDPQKPLAKLMHGIRKGGNLGAHFDADLDADEDTARLLLDLLDELLKFLLITPQHIEDLHERVSQ